MAMIPRLLRPSVLIRRKATYDGLLGSSTFWKGVAAVVYGRSTMKRLIGKNAEVVDTARLGPGRTMQVVTTKPLTKRRRRKLRKAGIEVPSMKEHRVLAELWAKDQAAR